MRRRFFAAALGGALAVLIGGSVGAAGPNGNARVTQDFAAGTGYVRYDGGTDATLQACSTGRRPQNEPSVAVDPTAPNVVIAGSNDYCAQILNGEVWPGYYRSTDGGGSWTNSLLPGYPKDESPAGLASPAHGKCGAAGDPTQAFDGEGRLFYAFICFNRSQPINGSVYAATYDQNGARYLRTVLIDSGTPSALFAGLFQDKINVVADQQNGNVYVAWSRYDGFAFNNAVLFARSVDHGVSFSRPYKVTPVAQGTASFADLAVGPNGAVYLTYITYPSSERPTWNIWLQKSSDGGVTFAAPRNVAAITAFDSNQFSGNGAYDCGDGPFACPSGFTYSRFFSSSAVAADARGVHVVYSAENAAGQAKIYVRNSPDGLSWPTTATTLDAVSVGHQWSPDIASAAGKLTVVFYDSRNDRAYSPNIPPGDTAAGKNSGDVVHAFVARSSDGGQTWDEMRVSSHGSNFGWETHGSRRDPFWGDYIYVSSVVGGTNVVWTDSRDLVRGDDPREVGEDDDEDGFDVYQPCTYVPNDINAASYSSPTIADPCLSQGGLDQNIYGSRVG